MFNIKEKEMARKKTNVSYTNYGKFPDMDTLKEIMLFGVKKGGVLMMAAFAAGCLAMFSKALAWPALLLLLAPGMGIYTTLIPLAARRVFGSRDYPAIWALISTAGCIGVIVGYPLWGVIYDLTGTYTLGLIGAAVLLMMAMWCCLVRNIIIPLVHC